MTVAYSGVDDLHVKGTAVLATPTELRAQVPSDPAISEHVVQARANIRNILAGTDPRLLAVVGPCSIHDTDAARDYATWLAGQAAEWRDELLVVMRVHLQKPRTRVGWQGFLDDPLLDGSGRLDLGLFWGRQLFMAVNALGLPVSTEFVDPIVPQYLADLTSWAAVGARTVESPIHRQLASGLSSPVGFKNNTSGDIEVAINAVGAARTPQRLLSVTRDGAPAVLSTGGNPDCHVVLRGGTAGPNYDAATIEDTSALLRDAGLPSRVMVDCSHGNCGGSHVRQREVASAVAAYLRDGGRNVMGVMLESSLVEGRQALCPPAELVYGQSITDACIGLDDTAAALRDLATAVHASTNLRV